MQIDAEGPNCQHEKGMDRGLLMVEVLSFKDIVLRAVQQSCFFEGRPRWKSSSGRAFMAKEGQTNEPNSRYKTEMLDH